MYTAEIDEGSSMGLPRILNFLVVSLHLSNFRHCMLYMTWRHNNNFDVFIVWKLQPVKLCLLFNGQT